MTKDYKQASPGGRASLLPGIAIGIVIGLAAAIAVVLFVRKTPDSFVDRTQQPAQTDTRAVVPQPAPPAVSTQPAPTGEKPRFDFYNILPGNEEPPAPKEPAQPTGESAPPAKQEQYFLQLGSFQSETEADNLKAKVALMGVEARIETTNVPDKGLFHRVRVGPYATMAEVARVRDQLNQNGLSSSLVKVDQTN